MGYNGGMSSPGDHARAVEAAFGASPLAALPQPARQALRAQALRVELPAGALVYHQQDEPACALVVAGLARVFLAAPDGRQVTVRYARPGDLLGVAAVVGGPSPTSVAILADATMLLLPVDALRQQGQQDPAVGWLLAEELARRINEILEAMAGASFGSLRQRIARHLLDLASPAGAELVARVSQQELADAVGSVRPVVARVIRDLRLAGLVSTAPAGIVLRNPAALLAETWSPAL